MAKGPPLWDTRTPLVCIININTKLFSTAQIVRFIGSTWGPPGADRTQVGPVLAPWTLPSGCKHLWSYFVCEMKWQLKWLALSPAIRVVMNLSCIDLNFDLVKLNCRWYCITDESLHTANVYWDMMNYPWIKFKITILVYSTQDFDSIGISRILQSASLNCIMDHSGYEFSQLETTLQYDIVSHWRSPSQYDPCTSAVREITKSSSTFSATNISNNLIWLFQLHYTIQMKSNIHKQLKPWYYSHKKSYTDI